MWTQANGKGKTPMRSEVLTLGGALWTIAASTGLVTRLSTGSREPCSGGFWKELSSVEKRASRLGAHTARRQYQSPKPPEQGFLLCESHTRTPSVSKGQSSAYACPAAWKERAKDANRCGTTHRIVQALIERLGQAWLNVTHRSSHPDESIRQAHLVWVRQMNCPDGDERKPPVTRWRYA